MHTEPVGMAWYKADDYKHLRTIFVDGDKLPEEFQEWQTQAEKIHERLVQRGHSVFKAIIEPNRFFLWCRLRDQIMDAQARMDYASEFARIMAAKRN